MRKLIALAIIWCGVLVGNQAQAQPALGYLVTGGCGIGAPTNSNGLPTPFTIDTNGKLCVNATVSASISGFRPTNYGTPISVTSSGVTGTLPTNMGEVVATNVGTTQGAYCALGGTATTSDQYIAPNGGWFAFGISGDTQLTCITSSSTTTVNTAGGSGLPTGTGGGGGGSGSSGAVTLAAGAVVSGAYLAGAISSGGDVTEGAIGTSAGCTAGASNTLIQCGYQFHSDLTSPQVGGANRIGFTTPQADTTGGCTWAHYLSAASNNATLVSTGAHTLCGFEIVQTTTTLGDFRPYDSATSPTCSSATGVVGNYAVQSNAVSPGMKITGDFAGRTFVSGLAFCLTGAVADNDNTNFTTGVQINIGYK